MSTPLTERPFTTSKYILPNLCATGKDGEVAMHFPLIHQELNQTVRAREMQTRQTQSQPLLFVSVSRRADINPQIGDKADKLKGDTKRKDTFRKDMLSYFFSYHSSLLKQLLLNENNILLLKLCHFPGRLFEHISLPGLTSGSVLIDFHYVIS